MSQITAAEAVMVPTIVLGQITHTLNAVIGALVQELLERIGYRVSIVEGAQDEVFPLLETGAIDLMAVAWLPDGHAKAWARHGGSAEEIASLYSEARFFWAVPDYVPEEAVASIADLATPAVAERMGNLIAGNGPTTDLTARSRAAMAGYGLATAGYEFCSGSQRDWLAAYETGLSDSKWFVFPTCAPQYLNRDGLLRPLADPLGVMGGINRGVLVSPKDRLDAIAPRARQVLGRVKIGLEGVTEMDRLVNFDKRTPKNAALAWMSANSRRVEAWLRT